MATMLMPSMGAAAFENGLQLRFRDGPKVAVDRGGCHRWPAKAAHVFTPWLLPIEQPQAGRSWSVP